METKHTQGPWSYTVCQSDQTLFKLLDSNSRVIGHVRRGTGGREEAQEFEANAELISAAPELLEALQGLVHSATKEANEKGLGGYHGARLADAKAAILKATSQKV